MIYHVYLKVLENDAVSTVCEVIEEGLVYQHDNDPKYTAQMVKNYFRAISAEGRTNWNPIKILWTHLEREV